jgi:hypothetical protein
VSDIVERLRAMAGPNVPNVCTEAADEIERLRLTNDERMAIWLASDDYLHQHGGRAQWIRLALLGLLGRLGSGRD